MPSWRAGQWTPRWGLVGGGRGSLTPCCLASGALSYALVIPRCSRCGLRRSSTLFSPTSRWAWLAPTISFYSCPFLPALDASMAKGKSILIKLVSSANTGFFYATQKCVPLEPPLLLVRGPAPALRPPSQGCAAPPKPSPHRSPSLSLPSLPAQKPHQHCPQAGLYEVRPHCPAARALHRVQDAQGPRRQAGGKKMRRTLGFHSLRYI